MATIESVVETHYAIGGILDRIVTALKKAGIDPDRPTYQDLQSFDQLHGRGVAATREHLEHSGIRSDMSVLDLGCGIGGSSRFLAAAAGCRVTGVDLTQEFVDVAQELTRRCGLGEKITYRQANALALPFADATFDHVWCHNVTMNIADKAGLAREIARVLKPGGRFSCSELGKGPSGEPVYPLPWASDISSSFLATPAEMRTTLERAGLRIVQEIDLAEAYKASMAEARERANRGEAPLQTNHIVMGDDFLERARNSGKGIYAGALVEHLLVAEKA